MRRPEGTHGLSRPVQHLIHRNAWKGYSRTFRCKILHRLPLRDARMASQGLHAAWAGSPDVVVVDRDAAKCIGAGRRSEKVRERQEARNDHQRPVADGPSEGDSLSLLIFESVVDHAHEQDYRRSDERGRDGASHAHADPEAEVLCRGGGYPLNGLSDPQDQEHRQHAQHRAYGYGPHPTFAGTRLRGLRWNGARLGSLERRWNGDVCFERRDVGRGVYGPPAVAAETILRLQLLSAVPAVPILRRYARPHVALPEHMLGLF